MPPEPTPPDRPDLPPVGCRNCGADLSTYPVAATAHVCPTPPDRPDPEAWRPPFCPDPKGCAPLIHPQTDSDNMALDNPAYAVHCFGGLSEPLVWTMRGVEHVEDLSTCSYSPLKGVIRWLENVSDWAALLRAYRAAIPAANERSAK